jgi:hypothetical protein
MRLDAVYVLGGPRSPAPTPALTRRALLIAGGSFFLGGACGYALGAKATAAPATTAPTPAEPPKSSGDANLDELRRLATIAPIEELMGVAPNFLNELDKAYLKDEIACSGLGRVAKALLDGFPVANRRILTLLTAQMIEKSQTAVMAKLRHLPQELRALK